MNRWSIPSHLMPFKKHFKLEHTTWLHRDSQQTTILKGKVICGCCGGKMQRKRGTCHADWYFFTCIIRNRLGADRCIRMYVREEDIFNAIYRQLKDYMNKHYITNSAYKQKIQKYAR